MSCSDLYTRHELELKICLATKHISDLFLKKDGSGFVMICDTTCGYCQKEVKSAHGIQALYMYFNGSGIWGGETISIHLVLGVFSALLSYST